jgi:hypothetical protein
LWADGRRRISYPARSFRADLHRCRP